MTKNIPFELFDYLLPGCARSYAEELVRGFREVDMAYVSSTSVAPDPGDKFGQLLSRLWDLEQGKAVVFLDHYLDYLQKEGAPWTSEVHADDVLRGLMMVWPDRPGLVEYRKLKNKYNQEGTHRRQDKPEKEQEQPK